MKYLILTLCLFGCSSTPSPKAVETDLCSARKTFVALEAVDLTLQPVPGSARAKVEAAEDALCAIVSP